MSFWVYILRCADNSYYTGHTDNLEKRIGEHQTGAIPSCYTFKRHPLKLVYSQDCATREEALAAEQQIKGWSRKKKEAMMSGDWAEVSRLAQSRTPVRPEPVEGQPPNTVRPEPIEGQPPNTVRPEPVEGQPPNTVRPEPVEGQPPPTPFALSLSKGNTPLPLGLIPSTPHRTGLSKPARRTKLPFDKLRANGRGAAMNRSGWQQMRPLAEVCQIKPPKAEARQRISGKELVSFVPMEDLGIDQKVVVPTQTKPLEDVAGSYTLSSLKKYLLHQAFSGSL